MAHKPLTCFSPSLQANCLLVLFVTSTRAAVDGEELDEVGRRFVISGRRLQSQGKTNPNKVLRSTARERALGAELGHQQGGWHLFELGTKTAPSPLLIPAYQGGATASGLRGCAEPSRPLLGGGKSTSGEAHESLSTRSD